MGFDYLKFDIELRISFIRRILNKRFINLKNRNMNRIVCIILGSVVFSLTQISGQKNTAAEFWRMEQDTAYKRLAERQIAGDTLSIQEQNTLAEYKAALSKYFEGLPDEEKSLYYKYRAKWASDSAAEFKVPARQIPDVFSGERSMYTQYLITSGLFGSFYGGAAIAFFELEDNEGLATGLPLLTAGASVLIPILTLKDKFVSYNSLSLAIHGKAIGAMQGLALGAVLTGDNVDEGKLLLAISTASSIALGRLGYSLGKYKPWTEGRAGLYSYYGTLMPFEGLALVGAFNIEDPRVYGLASLGFGAGGYLIADRIAGNHDFTIGDLNATGTLAGINALLGFLILADLAEYSDEFNPSLFLIPAAGALGGTIAGHLVTRDAKLTTQQGRNIALATAGGEAVGLGLTTIFTPESMFPYYAVSYITGLSAYAIMVGIYKKTNNLSYSDNLKKSRWDINIMPQNLVLNRKIASYAFQHPEKRIDFLPAFSATLNF